MRCASATQADLETLRNAQTLLTAAIQHAREEALDPNWRDQLLGLRLRLEKPLVTPQRRRILPLIAQGALAQLTASSLSGLWGKTVRHSAETLLKKGLVHCIASDAHGVQKRAPCVLAGLECARKLVDRDSIQRMIETLPAAIVKNEPVRL